MAPGQSGGIRTRLAVLEKEWLFYNMKVVIDSRTRLVAIQQDRWLYRTKWVVRIFTRQMPPEQNCCSRTGRV